MQLSEDQYSQTEHLKSSVPTTKPPVVSIALISATTLGYEVLLTRLFSILQWHHFAYMAISIALLGFGASGTFLALKKEQSESFGVAYLTNLLLFGIVALPCFLFAQGFAVHPEQLLWQPSRLLGVSLVYLLLALPFFFAANALGLSLMHFREAETRVYAADLVGAGLGSAGIIAILYVLFPMQALKLLTVLGFASVTIGALELRSSRRTRIASLLLVGITSVLITLLPENWTRLAMSPFKSLPQQLNIMDSAVEVERSSPLGLVTVVRSPSVPFRHAPGLSLHSVEPIPEQRAVFFDGDGLSPIDAGGDKTTSAYLDQLTSALPYHMKHPGNVVVLGAGGGSLVRQALYHEANNITAVELNHQIVDLIHTDYRDFTNDLYRLPQVNVKIDEARGFLADGTQRFDLIQVEQLDSFVASSAGLHALSENYLYTVEAFESYLARLNAGGYLVINRWIKLPPRDTLKLVATVVEALRRSGVTDPAAQLLLIRGWQTSTLLIKNGSLDHSEITAAKNFTNARAFDIAYYKGMPSEQANRFNVLPRAYYYEATQALTGSGAKNYLREYKFNIEPATDNKPYFSYFFKWRTLPEIVSLVGRGGVPLLESAYLVLIATLAQAICISVLLILLPLKKRMRSGDVHSGRMAGYFAALGFAFFFIEIAFIQKFVLFLHHPVLSVATILSGFLVFAGLGSLLAGSLRRRFDIHHIQSGAILWIITIGILFSLLAPELVFKPLAAAALPFKLVVSLLITALLATPMGMPFPLAIARLGKRAPNLIPVAWAINGCASVISAVLATVLTIHFGFTVVLLLAYLLYLSTVLTFRF